MMNRLKKSIKWYPSVDLTGVLSDQRIWLGVLAPVYVFSFSLFRCYVETALLAREEFFSYYTALHHMLWNSATIVMIILLVHFILKVPVSRLLWLMYGITLMVIPLLFAVVTGRELQLEYLRGSFSEILGHILTFCLTYTRNRPLTIEIIVIFLSMIAVGYIYSRSWRRAFILAVVVHVSGNLFAVHWFGPIPHARSVINFNSQLTHHQFMAAVWLAAVTVLTLVFVWRARWVGRMPRLWRRVIFWSASAWLITAALVKTVGWFHTPFDIFIAGLPIAFLATVMVFIVAAKAKIVSRGAWMAVGIVFVLQLAVMGPVYLDISERYLQSERALPSWLVPIDK